MSTISPLQQFENAIGQEEGWNVSGSVAQQNNNPGNIQPGGVEASYDTADEGFDALGNLLTGAMSGTNPNYSPNESLQQFEDTYTGGDTNAASNVSSILGNGVTPSTLMSNILGKLTGNSSTTAPTSGTSNSTSSSFLQDLFGALTGQTSGSPVTSIYLERGVAILAGLILLAGAVFSFREVHDTVIQAGKGALKAAQTSAEVVS